MAGILVGPGLVTLVERCYLMKLHKYITLCCNVCPTINYLATIQLQDPDLENENDDQTLKRFNYRLIPDNNCDFGN